MVAGLLTVVASGAIYQAVATEVDRRANRPAGELVDVGGHRLHIDCAGQGSPTVILESGFGHHVNRLGQHPTADREHHARVLLRPGGHRIERAGPGASRPPQIAQELDTLLGRARIDGPYVLVGHSFGGLYVRMFAARHPADVAGMVLVDASHPDMWTRLPPEVVATLKPPAWQVSALTFLTGLGFFRLTTGDMTACGLPVQKCREAQAYLRSTRYRVTWGQEMLAPHRDSQVRATGCPGDRPLVVLSAGNHAGDFAAGI